ncbi:hypothetical protein N7468_005148 [Penicillium chermesinum]|uniref:Uncharacterized protein n=1 Tax=Penicillium chermesinum TaxID=63820 RepID=A0A9W9TMX9_9EURO|nr:uncharacterized protein N7468_005148 [Penicillium chermesinum]KAJ5232192.1 hypothetical protein N7468_005148 [Penicillium chermesinum]
MAPVITSSIIDLVSAELRGLDSLPVVQVAIRYPGLSIILFSLFALKFSSILFSRSTSESPEMANQGRPAAAFPRHAPTPLNGIQRRSSWFAWGQSERYGTGRRGRQSQLLRSARVLWHLVFKAQNAAMAWRAIEKVRRVVLEVRAKLLGLGGLVFIPLFARIARFVEAIYNAQLGPFQVSSVLGFLGFILVILISIDVVDMAMGTTDFSDFILDGVDRGVELVFGVIFGSAEWIILFLADRWAFVKRRFGRYFGFLGSPRFTRYGLLVILGTYFFSWVMESSERVRTTDGPTVNKAYAEKFK